MVVDPKHLEQLLASVRDGKTSVDLALRDLADLPFRDLGFANVDHHRHLRLGFPEVVFGSGKTAAQISGILNEMSRSGSNALATRVDAQKADLVIAEVQGARYHADAEVVVVEKQPIVEMGRGTVLVVSAGTSDQKVASEAALTARFGGSRVETLFDVGVAGIHRLLARKEKLDAASVLIVVAGMEGALPSVVGGLCRKPIIAVPTSVGYGASFGGISALLGVMNSCAPGVLVVNIDNGFGAGYAAAMINRREERDV